MMQGENYAFCLISITLMVTHFVCHTLGHLPDDRLTMSLIRLSPSARVPLERGRPRAPARLALVGRRRSAQVLCPPLSEQLPSPEIAAPPRFRPALLGLGLPARVACHCPD